MEKIKKYWREILIGILVLFGMNKCTQSCNRGIIIEHNIQEIHKLDSTITQLSKDTLYLKHQLELSDERINTANANAEMSKAQKEVLTEHAKVTELQNKLNRKNSK